MLNTNIYVEIATVFGVTFGGTFLSLIACSQLYKRMKLKYTNEEKEVRYMKHKSLNEYFRDYEQLYSIDLVPEDSDTREHKSKYLYVDECKKFENRFVHECTPDGGVIMKFCGDDKLFLYWSDATVKHRYLVTCARKFCKLYKCEELYYLDTNSVYDEEDEKFKEDESKSDTESDENNENDFLFLKHNIKRKESDNDKKDDDDKKDDNDDKKDNDTDKREEKNVKTSIRFRKEGSIRDYSMLKSNALDTATLTYRSFKIK